MVVTPLSFHRCSMVVTPLSFHRCSTLRVTSFQRADCADLTQGRSWSALLPGTRGSCGCGTKPAKPCSSVLYSFALPRVSRSSKPEVTAAPGSIILPAPFQSRRYSSPTLSFPMDASSNSAPTLARLRAHGVFKKWLLPG